MFDTIHNKVNNNNEANKAKAANKPYCFVGGYDPRQGPECFISGPHRAPIPQPDAVAIAQMDCYFPAVS